MNIRALQQQRAKAVADRRAMLDQVGDGEFSAEDQTRFDALTKEVDRLDRAIAREAEQIELERSAQAAPAAGALPIVTGMRDRREDDPRGGFTNMGEFVHAVYTAGLRNAAVDDRLMIGAAAPTTFGSEAVGTDGGFVVPPEFSGQVFTLALGDDALLPMTDQTPVSGNSMVFPKDETTPWGTDGIRGYWQQEATAGTQTKPKLGTTMLRLHKLMALVPLTDELVADWSAGGSYITPLMARSIRWKTNEAILLGTGAGQPQGMFTGNCAVVQAKDSGQATKTVTVSNVANMISRLPPGAFAEAVWLIGPDTLPSLFTLTLGNYPIYLPINQGVQGSPYGTLMGRPIYVSQHAAAFSAQGDIMLIAPTWYRTITKAGAGVEMAQSLHLYFDADAVAFRALFRVDGQPKILNPIAQAKGTNTLSPFIQLAAR